MESIEPPCLNWTSLATNKTFCTKIWVYIIELLTKEILLEHPNKADTKITFPITEDNNYTTH